MPRELVLARYWAGIGLGLCAALFFWKVLGFAAWLSSAVFAFVLGLVFWVATMMQRSIESRSDSVRKATNTRIYAISSLPLEIAKQQVGTILADRLRFSSRPGISLSKEQESLLGPNNRDFFRDYSEVSELDSGFRLAIDLIGKSRWNKALVRLGVDDESEETVCSSGKDEVWSVGDLEAPSDARDALEHAPTLYHWIVYLYANQD